MRVAVSIMPIADSAWKPRGSRMPQPPPPAPRSAMAVSAVPAPIRTEGEGDEDGARQAQDGVDAAREPPADRARRKGHGGRHGDLPQVAREVVGPERRPPRTGLVRSRDERRGQRVLDAGAEPRHEEERREREHPGRERRDAEIAEGRHGRAHHQEPPLAPALGEDAGRDLRERHAGGVDGLEDADAGQRQAELRRPEGQEDVEHVGEAVVEDVGERRREEDGPGGGDHRRGPAPSESRARVSRSLERVIGPDRTPAALGGSRFGRARGQWREGRSRIPSTARMRRRPSAVATPHTMPNPRPRSRNVP